jgi:hypothetical protein
MLCIGVPQVSAPIGGHGMKVNCGPFSELAEPA